ncbi:MAG: peptidoglycan DD-metalloendopeptidase family protein, partial [Saprospiraceae bacterium]|nr:peptidoglycan DD-metalloendopeptidase family protein [Saprospiraceae bacterium]
MRAILNFRVLRNLLLIPGIPLLLWTQEQSITTPGSTERLQQAIETTQTLLRNTGQQKLSALKQLDVLQSQIRYRSELQDTLQKEIAQYQLDWHRADHRFKLLHPRMVKLKSEYFRLLKMKALHRITFNPFLGMMYPENLEMQVRRWYILQLVERRLRETMRTLERSQEEMKSEMLKLQAISRLKDSISTISAEDRRCLSEDLQQVKDLITRLNDKQESLASDLGSYKRKKDQSSSFISGSVLHLNKQTNANKKEKEHLALVMPMENAIILSRFGKNMASGSPHLQLRNNGIDLQSPEPFVRAATDAEVVQIRRMQDRDYVVITRSGGHYIVYSNLQTVLLREGERIARSSVLGKSLPNETGNYEMHLEVWKGATPKDPSPLI